MCFIYLVYYICTSASDAVKVLSQYLEAIRVWMGEKTDLKLTLREPKP